MSDLTRTRQEHEDVALLLAQGTHDRLRDGPIVIRTARRRQRWTTTTHEARFHRKGTACSADDRSVVEELRDRGPIQGRRHDQYLEIRRQVRSDIEHEREPQIPLQTTFVKLI